jgi:hypothetical protein
MKKSADARTQSSGQVSVKLDKEQYDALVAEAQQAERPISTQLRIILREHFNGAKS